MTRPARHSPADRCAERVVATTFHLGDVDWLPDRMQALGGDEGSPRDSGRDRALARLHGIGRRHGSVAAPEEVRLQVFGPASPVAARPAEGLAAGGLVHAARAQGRILTSALLWSALNGLGGTALNHSLRVCGIATGVAGATGAVAGWVWDLLRDGGHRPAGAAAEASPEPPGRVVSAMMVGGMMGTLGALMTAGQLEPDAEATWLVSLRAAASEMGAVLGPLALRRLDQWWQARAEARFFERELPRLLAGALRAEALGQMVLDYLAADPRLSRLAAACATAESPLSTLSIDPPSR